MSKRKPFPGFTEVTPTRTPKTDLEAYLDKYGLKPDDYRFLYHSQQGRCAICREMGNRYPTKRTKPAAETRKTLLVIDHNHKTGQVRGLLCYRCNTLLGFALDDPEILRAALAYLRIYSQGTDHEPLVPEGCKKIAQGVYLRPLIPPKSRQTLTLQPQPEVKPKPKPPSLNPPAPPELRNYPGQRNLFA